jgi:hypothetical protein
MSARSALMAPTTPNAPAIPEPPQIYVCHPSAAAGEPGCAKQIVWTLACHACLLPVNPSDREVLVNVN